MAAIQIDKVSKSFGDTAVIKEVSIPMADGEFVVLVGPSGCGKSTLLRMISGLERVSAGEIRIGERLVNHLPAKERDIAMVFQNYALYPHMTVADNMAFAMKMRNEPKAEIERRLANAAAILGLEPLMQRFPKQLSGGQRQRVAMGRAIVRDPQVFLFDEPLSNLDAKLRVQMRAEIKALHRRLGTTMVYVTHDQIEAMTMADRIVVMRDGVVEQMGEALELYDRPRNVFVAGFIGSPAMNFVPGRVESPDGGAPVLRTPEGLVLALPEAARRWAGQDCTYGVRPEDIALGSGGGAGEASAVVRSIEPTGPETHVVLGIGETLRLNCVLRERTQARVDDRIGFAPDVRKVHLFDTQSGLRLPFDA